MSPPRRSRRLSAGMLVLLLGCGAFWGCGSKKPPIVSVVRDATSRNPVVLIPGISGSRLVDTADGTLVWGRSGNFFLPRDGGRRLILPIDAQLRERDTLRPAGAVLGFKLLGVYEIDIYQSLITALEANGYKLGDLDDPRPGDSLFVFAYDWRRGNVETARALSGALDRLREARGDPPLAVDLICQSNAATVARYYIKYDGAPLEEAEAGRARPSDRVRVERLILVGTANGGALSLLRDFNLGRSYVPLVGRRFQPETLFTMPSMYEALPVYRADHFFDEEGNAIDADPFDPQDWKRYGWSIYGKKAARRLKKVEQQNPALGDEAGRAAFLAQRLADARRLDALLRLDVPGFGGTRYYDLQNLYKPTSDRALLRQRKGRWQTVFNEDRPVRKNPYLFQLASTPGDGHATWASQDWLSPQELAARSGRTVSIPTVHRRIVVHPATHRLILEALAESP